MTPCDAVRGYELFGVTYSELKKDAVDFREALLSICSCTWRYNPMD
jgi:hypothetical protein